MKKLLFALLLLTGFGALSQNYNMSNGTFNACGGTFYDAGGAGGNYGINQNFTMTFCPSTINTAVQLNFTMFSIENNADIMYVYDGADATAPVLGTFTGNTSPGILQATGTNTTGCLTIRFISDSSTTGAGWAATIACVQQCQQIASVIDSTIPAAGADNIIKICQGDPVTFNGSGIFSTSGVGATYTWDFDNGTTGSGQTATTTYTSPGVYRVNLTVTDPLNCRNTNLLNQIVQVSTTPQISFNKSADQICYGYTADITPAVAPTPFNYECTPPVSGTTFLPDVPSGVVTSYTTSIVVDCFSAGQTLTNISQLQSICLNMEHSYTGDLQIAITSPSNQTIILKYYSNGAGSGGGGLHLGHPWDDGDPATDIALGPGAGLDYCFSMAGAVYLVNGPTIPSLNTAGSSIVPGNYLPSQSFAGLVGSLLNGTWTISVTDNLGSDNGYIFSWGLTFDPNLIPGDLSFTPTIVSQAWVPNPLITDTNGSTITVTPDVAGTHCFNYVVTDNFGCTYTAAACIDMLDQFPLEDPQDITLCEGELFDLTQNIPVMLDGVPANAYGFLFHHSVDDAQNVASPISPDTAYAGTDGEIIYVSIEDYLSGSGCYEVRQFVLHVEPCGEIETPEDMYLCDTDNNGVELFDLSGVPAVALGTNDAADYVVTIHLSQADADSGASPIDTSVLFPGADGQQLFPRLEDVDDPTDIQTTFFTLHLIPVPVPTVSDITACDSYTLPTLPTGQYYNTAADGSGQTIPAMTVITTTQVIWTVAETGTTPNCRNSAAFTVTINVTPVTPVADDVTACDSYELPVLPAGQFYNTAAGGSGTDIPALTVITAPTTTIWVYSETATTPNCLVEDSFTVTINATPAAPIVSDVTACDSYTLPALPAGQYYNTAADGSGQTIPATTVITTTQLIWTVAETGTTPNCRTSASFTVTINVTPATPVADDVTACDSYELPVLPAGQFYNTASGGSGADIPALTVITAPTTTIWVYSETATTPNCLVEDSFIITINQTPVTPIVSDVTVCDSYTLPALPAGQYYNTAADGSGQTIPATTAITETQLIWTVAETGTTPNCRTSASFTVTVNVTPVAEDPADVTACEQYVLPALTVGQYHTAANGGGTVYPFGHVVTATETIWVYAETGTVPNCATQNSFTVTIVYPPVIATQPTDLHVCDENNDGFGCFDLTGTIAQVTGGDPNLAAAIFLTDTDAQLGNLVNAIPDPSNYCTIDPGSQTLYVRVWAIGAADCAAVAPVTLIVDARPVANDPVADFAKCDTDANPGTEDFILADHIGAIVANAAGLTITFYTSQAGAQTQDAAEQITASPYTSAGEIVWVRLENAAGCIDVVSFELVVWPLPVVADPLPSRTECIGADGLAQFDLNSYIPQISQGIPGVSVSFYASQADAGVPQSPLPSPHATAGGTIWVRLDNAHCFVVAPMELIGAVGPALGVPSPIAVCDDNNDCFASFDLTQVQEQVWGAPVPAGVTFAYYLTQTDAEQQNTINQIPSPAAYTNIDPCTQTVWISVTAPGSTCPSVVPLVLNVRLRPVANDAVAPYQVCDTDANGQAYFYLETLIPEILNGLDATTHTVAFFASQADIPGNPITNLSPYESVSTTIYAVVTDTLTGCFDTVEISLEMLAQPVVADIAPYRLCDDDFDQHASFDLAGYVGPLLPAGTSAGFFHSEQDAIDNINPIASPHVNEPAAAEFIWVRIENAQGCFVVRGMDIVVDPRPVPFLPPADYEELFACDSNNDGHGTFDLAAIAAYLQQGVPAGQMEINFFATQTDAELGNNQIAITDAYPNNEPFVETLYIGVNNPSTQGNCRSVWTLTLTVNPSAVANPMPEITVCDSGQDGFAVFDLTQNEAAILAAQPAGATVTVSYHTTELAASTGATPIVPATAYQNTSNPQTIWYRVEQQGQCDAWNSFEIRVDLPASLPSTLGLETVCATAAQGQFLPWDLVALTSAELPAGYDVTYYASLGNAQGDIDPIGDPTAYVNVTIAQTVGIRVTDATTGCVAFTTLTIQVLPLPQPQAWQADQNQLTECAQGGTGQGTFDLTQFEAYLANGDSAMAFTYHTSAADAEAGSNAITGDLAQYQSSGGVIYIRVEQRTGPNTAGQYCHVVLELTLTVNPQPALAAGQQLIGCEYPAGAGVFVFDLNEIAGDLMPGVDLSGYTFAFSNAGGAITAADAAAYTNTTNPEVITVVATDNATGCASEPATFELVVKAGATAAPYVFAPICDNDGDLTDGIGLFDLTQADATVLAGQAAPQFIVTYYASADDLASNTPIADPTAFASGTATLYAVVSNLGTDVTPDPAPCQSDAVTVEVSVEALVTPSIAGETTICIDNGTGAATPVTLTASPAGAYTYQWFLDGVDTGLTGQSVQVDLPGEYTVVVTSTSASACVSGPSQAFEVVESSQPFNLSYTVSGAFQDNQSIQVNVEGVNPDVFEYSLDGGPWLANGGLFANVGPGEHTVAVRSACGDASIIVQLINYPHFFTPNGDGYHDTWNIVGLENDGRTKIYIFDRYGKLIKQIAPDINGANGWDGTFNGSQMPSTDYWFTVEYPDPNANGAMREFKAHFSLKR